MVEIRAIEAQTHARLITWDNLTENDTDPPFTTEGARSDVTVAVWDTFNGGTVIWEGALQNPDEFPLVTPVWLPLVDIFNAVISFTASGIAVVGPNVLLLRPRVSAGTGVDVTARALMTGNRG